MDDALKEFQALTVTEQKNVLDYIAQLRSRRESTRLSPEPGNLPVAEEPFVGMWKDRADLTDSSSWVRQRRQVEWNEPHG